MTSDACTVPYKCYEWYCEEVSDPSRKPSGECLLQPAQSNRPKNISIQTKALHGRIFTNPESSHVPVLVPYLELLTPKQHVAIEAATLGFGFFSLSSSFFSLL